MASSRDTLNGPDWRDIQATFQSLEEESVGRVELVITNALVGGRKQLMVKATMHPWNVSLLDLRRSVSVNATLDRSGSGLGVAAIYRLLLALDYAISREWAVRQQTK